MIEAIATRGLNAGAKSGNDVSFAARSSDIKITRAVKRVARLNDFVVIRRFAGCGAPEH